MASEGIRERSKGEPDLQHVLWSMETQQEGLGPGQGRPGVHTLTLGFRMVKESASAPYRAVLSVSTVLALLVLHPFHSLTLDPLAAPHYHSFQSGAFAIGLQCEATQRCNAGQRRSTTGQDSGPSKAH